MNVKNRNVNQKRLMPYERHAEVSLPHGAVIDLGLWNRVQQTAERISGTKVKNTKIKKVFLLSGLLRLQSDNSSFHGTGATGRLGRKNYYFNKTHKIRLSAEDIETEAKRTVSQIIRGSTSFQDAIKQKSLATKSLKQFLVSQTRQIGAELSALTERKQAASRRFDLLSTNASESDLSLYRDDYKAELEHIRQETEAKTKALESIQLQQENLSFNEVGVSTLIDCAQETQDRIEAQDPVALKNAYYKLFEAVYVSLSPSEGSAVLNFVLRGHQLSMAITEEEKGSVGERMVALPGDNAADFSSTKIQMISRIQYLPLVKQESFLRTKYEVEGLSVKQIAALTFSSRSTVVKYLEAFNITLRASDRQIGPPPFGKRRRHHQIVVNEREQIAIEKAKQLRKQGLSFEKIAAVMNTMGVRTRTGRAPWYAKTVRDIIVR